MELNLTYNKENNNQGLMPIEQEIIEQYLLKYLPEDYIEILKKDTRIEVAMALSKIRENILNWYEFKECSNILQIGANMGEILDLLCKRANKVVAIEENLKKAEGIAKRHTKNKKIEIIVGKIKDIILEPIFDYIILERPDQIMYVKKWIKPNGTIILMTNNRFGISYFAGASFEGKIYNTFLNEKNKLYGKREIERLLNEQGLNNYQFYYPIPNYKMPNAIFSDKYIPNENTTKLMYNIMYEKGSVVVFDELKALKQLTKNGLFDIFTNSYLVEIKMEENTEKNPISFISFNNNRKEKYQLATIIYENEVKKKMINSKAEQHIKNIELNISNLKKLGFNIIDEAKKEEVVSKYIQEDTFDKIIANMLLQDKTKEAIELIEKWYEHIKERLLKNKRSKLNGDIQASPEEIEGLTILKNGYLDLVFENTFYKNDEFMFFDQEWYEDGIPLEFLLYRAIQNIYAYNIEIDSKYPKKNLLERFNLQKYKNLFDRIEEYIQKEIIEETMIKLNKQSISQLHDINYTGLLLNQIKDFEENDVKQNQYIKELEIDNHNKQDYIELLEQQVRDLQKNRKRRFF